MKTPLTLLAALLGSLSSQKRLSSQTELPPPFILSRESAENLSLTVPEWCYQSCGRGEGHSYKAQKILICCSHVQIPSESPF